jgi:hypothetical protein
MSKSTKRSPLKILLGVLLIIVCVIIIFFSALKGGEKLMYISFYNNSQREFTIPGLNSGFIPQGLDYLEDEELYLTCGYSSTKGEASAVYTIDSKGKATKIKLQNADGSTYTGHTGGIAHYGKYFYITGSTGCDVFLLSDLISGNEYAKQVGVINTPNDPAYCVVHDGKFYSGTFYRAGNYETPEEQRITTPAGDKNTALIIVYDLDDTAEFGVNPNPVSAYSTTGLVQGMTFTENEIVLSTSYGLATSHLYYYSTSKITTGAITLKDYPTEIPLYYLDSTCLVDDVKAPPMSEEIIYKDGRIYTITESASNKYIFGKFMSGYHSYSYKKK